MRKTHNMVTFLVISFSSLRRIPISNKHIDDVKMINNKHITFASTLHFIITFFLLYFGEANITTHLGKLHWLSVYVIEAGQVVQGGGSI